MEDRTKGLIGRQLHASLAEELEKNVISTVIGPRQVGKTTLLRQLMSDLLASGISERNTIFFNFDDLNLRSRLLENPARLPHEIEIRLGRPLTSLDAKAYIFLDEAQKVPGIFDMIKLLFDEHGREVKLILSGSSSIEVQKRAAETLAGRIRYHYLFPLTLKELLTHHGLWTDDRGPLECISKGTVDIRALEEIQASLWQSRGSILGLRDRLILFGSLPAVYSEPSDEEKWYILRDYAATYIEKDVRLLHGVGNLDLFHRLYRSLILQHGQILNVSNLANDLGASRNTIDSYINVLEQTYVLHRLPAFSRRPKVRLMKAPKVYLFDSGLVNHETRQTSVESLATSGRRGAIEEGFTLSHLLSIAKEMAMPPEVSYLRTYGGHEIDLVIEGDGTLGIEVTTEERMRKKRYQNIEYISENAGVQQIVIIGRFPELRTERIGSAQATLVPNWMAW